MPNSICDCNPDSALIERARFELEDRVGKECWGTLLGEATAKWLILAIAAATIDDTGVVDLNNLKAHATKLMLASVDDLDAAAQAILTRFIEDKEKTNGQPLHH